MQIFAQMLHGGEFLHLIRMVMHFYLALATNMWNLLQIAQKVGDVERYMVQSGFSYNGMIQQDFILTHL